MEENTSRPIDLPDVNFRALTELLPEAFLLLAFDGQIVAGNRPAAQLFREKHLSHTSLRALVVDPPEKLDRVLRIWAENGSMTPTSLTLNDQSIIRADGARLKTDGSSLILVRCIERNQAIATREMLRYSANYLTVQQNIAERLAQAKQQKELAETTAAMLAHELANPINGIAAGLGLLELEFENSSESTATEVIKSAKEEISRVASLLRDFRAIARPQVMNVKPVELSEIVKEVIAPETAAMSKGGIEHEVTIEKDLPPVFVDKDRIKQAIANLLRNALEAMPNGGRVSFTGRRQGKTIALDVSDSGGGIPTGVDPFQVFKTTKSHGTGLGVPIAAQIVASHKGRIEFRTEPDRGTTFTVYLPIAPFR